ncbi:hypothetical protein H257_04257 [Aphanomyces astaci]|uniref:Uncharacterized protein n=1 Tax=Aphanomyces astaci TaxID=112090 RepID=W4GV23_APHAT|nr:hypothetical protein H257_04257 [Aphanomyces astaci]ETV83550.1 hypothetical protein H257_04257 [Aphanomyces astaci]|eukprot:XP_009826980.1 hypothetical protein H257_04257 [Aphanomyces astaci]
MAEEIESDAPEADDHVAPLAPHEPSMLSSSDSSKDLVHRSTMSTDTTTGQEMSYVAHQSPLRPIKLCVVVRIYCS